MKSRKFLVKFSEGLTVSGGSPFAPLFKIHLLIDERRNHLVSGFWFKTGSAFSGHSDHSFIRNDISALQVTWPGPAGYTGPVIS